MNYHQPLILHIQGINPTQLYKDSRVDIIFDDGKLAYQSYRTEYKEGNFLLTPVDDMVDLTGLTAYPKNEYYLIRIWLSNLSIIPYGDNWYGVYPLEEGHTKGMISFTNTFKDFDYKGEDYVEIHSPPYTILSNPLKFGLEH